MSLLLGVVALCLLLEGAIPLLAPDLFRRRMEEMAKMAPGQLRFVGLIMCAAGFILGVLALAV